MSRSRNSRKGRRQSSIGNRDLSGAFGHKGSEMDWREHTAENKRLDRHIDRARQHDEDRRRTDEEE